MSSGTHRWKSLKSMKEIISQNHRRKKDKRNNCLINVAFEKSKYFSKTDIPYKFIFESPDEPVKSESANLNYPYPILNNVCRCQNSYLTKESLNNEPFSYSALNTFDNSMADEISEKDMDVHKLHADEYVEAVSVDKIIKLENKEVRCYCICPVSHDISFIIDELEKFKRTINKKDWKTFRLIVVIGHINSEIPILRKEIVSEYSSCDEDEKIIQCTGHDKFRDSRFIASSKNVQRISSLATSPQIKINIAITKIMNSFDNGINHSMKNVEDIITEIEHLKNVIDDDGID